MVRVAESERVTGESRAGAPTLVALLGAVFVLPLSIAGISATLPAIGRDLGQDPTQLQWVVNGFNVSFAISTLIWGLLADRIGLKRTFIINAFIMMLGSIASSVAPNLIILDLARVIAGIGAGAIQASAAAMISISYSGVARTKAYALLGTVLGFGLAFGPTISAFFTAALGWRFIFAIPVLALGISLLLRDHLPNGSRLSDDSSSRNSETRGSLPLHQNAKFIAVCLVPVVQSVGFIAVLTYLPTAFSARWGMSDLGIGLTMLMMTAPVLFLPSIGARIVVRFGGVSTFGVIYFALFCLVAGNLLIIPGLSAENPSFPLYLGLLLLGLSFGLPLGLIDGEALLCASADNLGKASGIFNFLRLGSEAAAVAAYGIVLTLLITSHSEDLEAGRRVAAGDPSQPGWFLDAFSTSQIAVVVISAFIIIALLAFHWLSRRQAEVGSG